VGGCTSYAKTVVLGCSANFSHTGIAADVASARASAAKWTRAAQDAASHGALQTADTDVLSHLLGYLTGSGGA
jgi:hypothetical protein